MTHLYSDRLKQLGVCNLSIHSTRLKDRVLASFPELQAYKEGRDILLASNQDVGHALRKACEHDADGDAQTLAKAARIVRKEIINAKVEFDGSFPAKCQSQTVPGTLSTLMAMLLFGANINHQSQVTQVQPLLSICQLALFNTVVRSSKEVPVLHHSKPREPPLPLYIGILIHNKTRKRHLVDKF